MQLTALLDHGARATLETGEIPCQSNDPELWFADTPGGVEFAKALCVSCPMIEASLPASAAPRSTGSGRGQGVVSSSSMVSSLPESGPGVAHARTPTPPRAPRH